MSTYLIFVNLVGQEEDGKYRYEFYFSTNLVNPLSEEEDCEEICGLTELSINKKHKTETHIVRTKIKFDLIQNNGCFSFKQCMDLIVAVAWENIDEYEEYPEDGRIFFMFGESYDKVERKLAMKNILML